MRKNVLVASALLVLCAAALTGGIMWWNGGFAVQATVIAPSKADISRAETLMPTDGSLAKVYARSCMACHSVADAQAPLTGHINGWTQRFSERGSRGLLKSAKEGFGNMPAMGLCTDCTDEQYTALISFMSGREDSQ
ncbi:Cytochrome c5 [Pseudovibrio axinellae]|uniref:Cytochrome c5 n=1 Tax=Pseudovibrio axinellae TaxID=989403 RepID=A0A165ZG24_9HYPH|nr:c-type cytochrome [Pseudovibrio axinellae]KZL19857.1 Cytochrome c5 [Pseudovibrio axinellae]SER39015.1 Cytochrome C oxidase, cbb3-type, subunit III [Pseudovibrio axinellae]